VIYNLVLVLTMYRLFTSGMTGTREKSGKRTIEAYTHTFKHNDKQNAYQKQYQNQHISINTQGLSTHPHHYTIN